MKQCTNCKSEIESGVKFCPVCGKEQSLSQNNNQTTNQVSKNPGNQNVPGWLIVLIIIFIIGFIYLGASGELGTSSSKESKTESPKYDTSKVYNIGETLKCPNFEITVDSIQIKEKGTYIDSYQVIKDPEWVAAIVTVRNTSNETRTFYSSNIEFINSNGEIINEDIMYYNVWGIEILSSPELTSGGSKTGFIPFTNTNQDNSNLKLKVDCNTGLFEDKVIYNVNISQ